MLIATSSQRESSAWILVCAIEDGDGIVNDTCPNILDETRRVENDLLHAQLERGARGHHGIFIVLSVITTSHFKIIVGSKYNCRCYNAIVL